MLGLLGLLAAWSAVRVSATGCLSPVSLSLRHSVSVALLLCVPLTLCLCHSTSLSLYFSVTLCLCHSVFVTLCPSHCITHAINPGTGNQHRSRAVTFKPQNGGASCPDLAELRACNTHGCGCALPCPEPKAGVCAIQSPSGHYQLSWQQAVMACRETGSVLANAAQFAKAYEEGLDDCHWGWLSDHSVRASATKTLLPACGGLTPGMRGDTTVYANSNASFDAYCFKLIPPECDTKPNSVPIPNLVAAFVTTNGPLEVVNPYWLLSEVTTHTVPHRGPRISHVILERSQPTQMWFLALCLYSWIAEKRGSKKENRAAAETESAAGLNTCC